jgi:hypothetical protein
MPVFAHVSRRLCAHDALEPPLVHSTKHSTWIGQGAWPSAVGRAGQSPRRPRKPRRQRPQIIQARPEDLGEAVGASANTIRGKRQPNLTPKICNADYVAPACCLFGPTPASFCAATAATERHMTAAMIIRSITGPARLVASLSWSTSSPSPATRMRMLRHGEPRTRPDRASARRHRDDLLVRLPMHQLRACEPDGDRG